MDSEDEAQKPRTIAVKLPRKYYRAVRQIAAQHELVNGQVICWAIDLLERFTKSGGTYGGR